VTIAWVGLPSHVLLLRLLLFAATPAAPALPFFNPTPGTGIVTGRVRAASSGVEVDGVVVSLEGTDRTAVTDSTGSYILRGVAAGAVQLRLAAHGFYPLEVTALIPPGGVLQVDVTLDALPDSAVYPATATLSEVRILAQMNRGERGPDTSAVAKAAPGAGGWTIDSCAIAATRLQGDLDVFRALATNPSINAGAASMTIADRGGSRDETLVTLDGIPIWSPYHATAVTSAISPDAVASVMLHDGASSAQYDGRLSGTLALSTPTGPVQGDHGAAALSPLVARAAMATPLPFDSGSWVFAARHHIELIPTHDAEPQQVRNDWGDVFSSIGGVTPVGRIRAIVFASGDRLSTGAPEDSATVAGASGLGRQTAWGSQAVGLTWQQSLSDGRVDGQIWDSRYASTMRWRGNNAGDGSHTLTDAAHDVGVASTLTWGRSLVGASIEHIATTYDVSQSGDSSTLPVAPTTFHLRGGPTALAAFAEHRWGDPADRWQVTAGIRGTAIVGSAPQLEPRLAIAVAPATNVWLSVGYARKQQLVQSFLNEESPLASLPGPDLPVAAGVAGVPVARSDELAATATSIIGSSVRLRVDLYNRRLENLVVVAPMIPAPASIAQVATGRGHADGVGLMVENTAPDARLTWRVSYGIGQTVLTSAGVKYHPTYERGNGAAFVAAYRIRSTTWLRVGAFGAAGIDPTEIDRSAAEGSDDDESGSAREPRAGSFDVSASALLASELRRPPASAELDVGLEHTWHTLSVFTGLGGIVAQPSWWALVQRTGGVMVTNHPQLRAGVEWGF